MFVQYNLFLDCIEKIDELTTFGSTPNVFVIICFHFGDIITFSNKKYVGFVSFNNIDNLKSAAQTAVHIASLVANERKEKTSLALIIQVNDVVKATLINDPRNHSLEEKKEILEKYNKIILSNSNEIASSSIRYSDSFTKLYFLKGKI